jgi:hypothetical protein
MLGVIEFLVLALLPGCWITFSLPLSNLRPWARWMSAIPLSPLLLCAEFYALRLLGLSFARAVPLLVLLNLPALFLVAKRAGKLALPDAKTTALLALIVALPVACLSPQILHPPTRMLYAHPWMHTEIAYRMAAGDLIPDDPDLVGIRLFYPWAGDLYQAVLSCALGSPPLYNYIWTNLLFLICVAALAAALVAELGGGHIARLASGVCLFFAVNFVGFALLKLLPGSFTLRHPGLFGDFRFTPWVLKFIDFQQMPLALPMFLAMLYLVIREWPRGADKSSLLAIALLLISVGLFYPILFPAACAVVAAQAVALFFFPGPGVSGAESFRKVGPVGFVLLICGVVALLHYHLMSRDRVTSALTLANWQSIVSKSVAAFLATLPLLIALFLVLRNSWKQRPGPTTVLLLGAAASALLNVLLVLPFYENEYKFMFTAAMCLAPFLPLALEPPLRRLGKWALPAGLLSTLVLAIPLIQKTRDDWFLKEFPLPALDLRHFYLRLDDREPLAPLCNAIRDQTPPNSLVILEREELHFPSLTARRLYAPPRGTPSFPGLNLKADTLLTKVKGYSASLLEARQSDIEHLYRSEDPAQRAAALAQMLAFRHPLAIVLDPTRDAALRDFLIRERAAQTVFSSPSRVLLLVSPRPLPSPSP